MSMTNTTYELTEHGRKRAAQRAISGIVLDVLLDRGEMAEQKGGTALIELDRRERKALVKSLKQLLRALTNDAPPYAVVGDSRLWQSQVILSRNLGNDRLQARKTYPEVDQRRKRQRERQGLPPLAHGQRSIFPRPFTSGDGPSYATDSSPFLRHGIGGLSFAGVESGRH